MIKLLCGALALASLAGLAGCNPSTTTAVSNGVATACVIGQDLLTLAQTDEAIANQIAGKQVVRTGTTNTIAALTPTACAQLGGVIQTLDAATAASLAAAAPATGIAPAK